MEENLKSVALFHIRSEIAFGFASNDEIFEMIQELMLGEQSFDENWAKTRIALAAAERLSKSKTWKKPTDFRRLSSAFDALAADHIIAMHFAGYTRQDAEDDARQVADALKANGIVAKGYCYYHEQDLERVIKPGGGELYVGYGAYTEEEGDDARIGQIVATRLGAAGLTLDWNGDSNNRIRILDILWQKLPDDQVWDGNRAIQLFARLKSQASNGAQSFGQERASKPWWKFW